MPPRIAGFVSRADAGLRPPVSVSRSITPSRGGAAVHYGGPAAKLADHAACVRLWRAWQTFHMVTRGWADIAYTGGYCDHGYAFAGRGHGVRTAAQGTNDGNAYWHAYVWLGGDGETPTEAALDALEWWVEQGRDVGGAGLGVRPHGAFHSTSCPGGVLTAYARGLNGVRLGESLPPDDDADTTPTGLAAPRWPLPDGSYFGPREGPAESVSGYFSHRSDLRRWQQRMADRGWRITVDGLYGPDTDRVVQAFREQLGKGPGRLGRGVWRAAWEAPVT